MAVTPSIGNYTDVQINQAIECKYAAWNYLDLDGLHIICRFLDLWSSEPYYRSRWVGPLPGITPLAILVQLIASLDPQVFRLKDVCPSEERVLRGNQIQRCVNNGICAARCVQLFPSGECAVLAQDGKRRHLRTSAVNHGRKRHSCLRRVTRFSGAVSI